MKNREYKRLAQSLNERMECRFMIDKVMMSKSHFNSFYYNDIEEGKLRTVTDKMLEDFDNDKAYNNKVKSDEDFLDAAFDLLYNRYPNFDKVRQVHISNEKIYVAVNEQQDAYTTANFNAGLNKMEDIFVGEFFTNDISIISSILKRKPRKIIEKDIRKKVCLTSSFKKNIAAIYEFQIDGVGIDVNKSLIGGQFDFNAGIYYPASLLLQYEIKRKNPDRNKHIIFCRKYEL